jgi:uncharacterized phage-associated protein
MKSNALAIANYFVNMANKCGVEIHLLGLVKRVYITHGFMLALCDRSAIDPRFDSVEAWRLGPVIPSVYHSFKHNGRAAITAPSIIVVDNDLSVEVPFLADEQVKETANFVWKRYSDVSDMKMVELLHRKGTPWGYFYKVGQNNTIPDSVTKEFYVKLLTYEKEYGNNKICG